MNKPWEPEVLVTPALASTLIGSQFPELAPLRLRPLGAGWDNAAFLVNDTWVFRLPRRELGGRLLGDECSWLPQVGPDLPVPVPVPTKIGRPTEGYPYPFAGYRFLPGATACSLELDDVDSARLARAVGAFLACLHRLEPHADTLREAPRDTLGRTDRAGRLPALLGRIDELSDLLHPDRCKRVREALKHSVAAIGWTTPPRWVHGDLYARHLLLDDRRELCGIIDWGDLHLGDPALDLAIAFSFFDRPAREELFDAYGPVGDDARERARFRALHYGLLLLACGEDRGDVAMARLGRRALLLAVE